MIALVGAVFLASLMGSLHCAGMCGAFVAFAVGIDRSPTAAHRARLQAAYNLGRLATYVLLGAIAGAVGAAFDLGASLLGVGRAAMIVAGAAMIVFGAAAFLRACGVRVPKAKPPKAVARWVERATRAAYAAPPMWRAAIMGLATTLLPCGWLYAFVITAAGTGSPALGALTMAVFWAGTLPVLVSIGTGAQHLAARLPLLGKRIPALAALLLIGVGAATAAQRSRLLDPAAHWRQRTLAPGATATERLDALTSEPPACCE